MTDEEKSNALPSWEECSAAVRAGIASPLQAFIEGNEPAGKDDVEWRASLFTLLESMAGRLPAKVR